MVSSDEETGTQDGTSDSEPQSNKEYVANIYNNIVVVVASILGIATASFLLFCIGWTFWYATPWIFPLLGLIIICEVAIWYISLIAGRNNLQKNWDDGTTCQMLWAGFLYFLILLAEGSMIGAIGYLIFVESPYWIQVVAYITLLLSLVILVLIHIYVHCFNIYCQDSQCVVY